MFITGNHSLGWHSSKATWPINVAVWISLMPFIRHRSFSPLMTAPMHVALVSRLPGTSGFSQPVLPPPLASAPCMSSSNTQKCNKKYHPKCVSLSGRGGALGKVRHVSLLARFFFHDGPLGWGPKLRFWEEYTPVG